MEFFSDEIPNDPRSDSLGRGFGVSHYVRKPVVVQMSELAPVSLKEGPIVPEPLGPPTKLMDRPTLDIAKKAERKFRRKLAHLHFDEWSDWENAPLMNGRPRGCLLSDQNYMTMT